MLGMRTYKAYKTYKNYEYAKSILAAMSVIAVVTSSFATNYVGGTAEYNLNFSEQPNLRKWPDLKLAFSKNSSGQGIFTFSSKKSSYGPAGEPMHGDPTDVYGTLGFAVNMVTGQFEDITVVGGVKAKFPFYNKGPLEASIKLGLKIGVPLEFTTKIGIDYSGPTIRRLGFGVDIKILKVSTKGLELAYGIDWTGGINQFTGDWV